MGNSCRSGIVSKDDGLGYTRNSSINWDFRIVPSERDYEITPEEIVVLRQHWKSITSDITIRVFAYNLFEKLFVFFQDTSKLLYVPETGDCISSQQWKEHPSFALHVRDVVNALGTVIQLIDQPDYLKVYLTGLEEFHRSLRGMKKCYIEDFIRIIDDSLAVHFTTLYSGEMKRAFRKVLIMLYFKLTWKLLV